MTRSGSRQAGGSAAYLKGVWPRLALCTLVAFPPASAARAAELPSPQQGLLKAAPQVLDYARKKGYRSLGVLKFRARQGNQPITDRVGPINLRVADQLELALIVKNSVANPITIVHDASRVAAKIPDASHLTVKGREKLFTGLYAPAWGKQRVTPDAFVTGVVTISEDFKRMTVGIVAFGRDAKLETVTQFEANPTVMEVIASGGSFSRGAFDGAATEARDSTNDTAIQLAAVDNAARVRSQQTRHPLQDARTPVFLDIAYDGLNQTVEFKNGEALIREPNEGEKVSFALRRRDQGDKRRYAAVLKVNGENTLFRERLSDLVCRKWVLEPGERPLTILGYQSTDTERENFLVLSKAASEARAMDYGPDVGTFSLTVFGEQGASGLSEPLLDDDSEDLAVLAQAKLPEEPPDSLDALKQRLLASSSRGLVAEGQRESGATRKVTFQCASTPLFTATISYRRP